MNSPRYVVCVQISVIIGQHMLTECLLWTDKFYSEIEETLAHGDERRIFQYIDTGNKIPQVFFFPCLLRKKLNYIKIISKEKLHVAFIESKIKSNVERTLHRTDFLGCHYMTTAVCAPLQKPVNA